MAPARDQQTLLGSALTPCQGLAADAPFRPLAFRRFVLTAPQPSRGRGLKALLRTIPR